MTATKKPTDAEIRTLADATIRDLVKKTGPGVTEEQVLEHFRQWVLPDRQLTIIRERLERWKEVAAKRAARRA